ncbi:MAG: MFS transporter, partial [Promethearchaeota archaeon]
MKKNREKDDIAHRYGIAPYIIVLICFVTLAARVFGYMETELLNTYIDHILDKDYIYIGIMVSFSATMGLITGFVFGIMSDNTRTKYGRRRPFILLGGIGAGIGMILFGFSPTYFWCFFLDVIIMGIFSNAYYAGQRVLVPDLIELHHRGRVNSYVNIMNVVGYAIPIVLTLVANEIFTAPNPNPLETGNILTQVGHVFLLLIGGLSMIIMGILGFIFLPTGTPKSELPPKKKFKQEIKETFNIKELKNQKEFFKLLIAMTIFMSGVNAMLSYLFNFLFSIGISTIDLITILIVAAPILFIVI